MCPWSGSLSVRKIQVKQQNYESLHSGCHNVVGLKCKAVPINAVCIFLGHCVMIPATYWNEYL